MLLHFLTLTPQGSDQYMLTTWIPHEIPNVYMMNYSDRRPCDTFKTL